MASIVFAIALTAASFPTALEDVEPWFDSRTDEEIWESLMGGDPNHASSVRLLDLSLGRFRTLDQVYLFKKWSEHFESSRPATALGLQALAWRDWMAPERLQDEEYSARLRERMTRERYNEEWGQLAKAFPNEISGVLAARLLATGSEKLPPVLEEIRAAWPDSGVSAFLRLRDGTSFAREGDGERAVDAWLEGIERYPVDWERAEWVERIVQGLRGLGHGVQATIVADGGAEDLRRLVRFRAAVSLARDEKSEEAREQLQGLLDDPETPDALKDLCQGRLMFLDSAAESVASGKKFLAALAGANYEGLHSALAQSEFSTPSKELAEGILSIANLRFDQGQIREAVLIWENVAERFPQGSMGAVRASGHLLEAHWRRIEAIRALTAAFPNERIDRLFAPLESSREQRVLEELDAVLERAEIAAASSSFSAPLLDLLDSLYRIHANLGRPHRPGNLFLAQARRGAGEERAILAERAQVHRPEEAIAILQIESGTAEESLDPEQKEILLALYEEKGQYKEAAAVARALAEEASGTPLAEKAWYKTAWLEYKSGDYRSSEKTLEELLPQQEPGTVEQAETHRLLALSNYQSGDYEDARGYFDTALESGLLGKGDREELALLNAYSYLYRQEYNDARARLESILASNPSRVMERRVNRLVQQLPGRN